MHQDPEACRKPHVNVSDGSDDDDDEEQQNKVREFRRIQSLNVPLQILHVTASETSPLGPAHPDRYSLHHPTVVGLSAVLTHRW